MQKAVPTNEKPKVAKGRLYLRPDEANRLIAAAGQRGRYPFRDKVLVRMAYRHGLRANEAVGMRWDALDLDGGHLQVQRAKGGNTSNHTLDRDELRDLRKLRKTSLGICVFETERGGPLSVDALQYICREAGKLAGLGDAVHPHQLRHAAGYALINGGTDVRLVQDFLGHKSITSTALYTALAPARLAAVRVR
jgi:integrase